MAIPSKTNAKFSVIEKIGIVLASTFFIYVIVVIGYQSADPVHQHKTRAERQFREYVGAQLKDPSSVKFGQTNFRLDRNDGMIVSGCYMAKNSFGAYNGYHQAYLAIDKQGTITKAYMDAPGADCNN